jgi:hypothetical protein
MDPLDESGVLTGPSSSHISQSANLVLDDLSEAAHVAASQDSVQQSATAGDVHLSAPHLELDLHSGAVPALSVASGGGVSVSSVLDDLLDGASASALATPAASFYAAAPEVHEQGYPASNSALDDLFAAAPAPSDSNSVPAEDTKIHELGLSEADVTTAGIIDSASAFGVVGPAWTHSGIEWPQGSVDVGSWTASVHTEEQQLGVDAQGESLQTTDAEPNLPLSTGLETFDQQVPAAGGFGSSDAFASDSAAGFASVDAFSAEDHAIHSEESEFADRIQPQDDSASADNSREASPAPEAFSAQDAFAADSGSAFAPTDDAAAFGSADAFAADFGSSFSTSDAFGAEATSSGFASAHAFAADSGSAFDASEGFGSNAAAGFDSVDAFGTASSGFGASEAFGTDTASATADGFAAESTSAPVVKPPVVPPLKLSFASTSSSEDAPQRTRETSGFPALSNVSTPSKANRNDDFDSDSGDEAAKKPKFKFVIKSSSEVAAAAAAAPVPAPIVLAPTPSSSDSTSSRAERSRRVVADESSDQPSAPEPALASDRSPLAKRGSVHNSAIDAQIKQYSKSQGISAAQIDVDEGHVDANQFRELESQLIELKLSWALVRTHV